jgi:hypothetical protein
MPREPRLTNSVPERDTEAITVPRGNGTQQPTLVLLQWTVCGRETS